MSISREDGDGYRSDTRQRLIDVAVQLTGQHGFAGTSLQMIADQLGFSKAAIYYHFRTRDQLLIAIMEPWLRQIRTIVEAAEQRRTPRGQIDEMVQGYAGVVARNRTLAALVVFDPEVHRILQSQPDWGDLIGRQLALVTQLDEEPTGIIKATALMTGLAGAATGAPTGISESELTGQLTDIGRRIMGLRRPARTAHEQPTGSGRAPAVPSTAPGRWQSFLTES
ncbi:AcrR family transcriptional regulator [Mycolicibacterium iranicum]|uniref:AcrR family transcriptional regulator n=1 Tax=Mycolicibacterium iranicum TaxID=912594 RepID=A0A839Q7X2_MYCIR|nr:TetR/AcrR family transcriptional regulator [Mycolicibacterium iranicum]MBB2992100.1 AcrR family transcriptional regulator [Mycolicibacterium iranicum]